MREFRIVATKYEHHNLNGKEYRIERISPRFSSSYDNYTRTYRTLEEAQDALDNCLEDAKKYEGEHNLRAANDRYGVIIHYSAIRIESREVSDWEVM